jgi:hypothetical protein
MTHYSFQGRAIARRPLPDFPGMPEHVIQRGDNRQPRFDSQLHWKPGKQTLAPSNSSFPYTGHLKSAPGEPDGLQLALVL